jgi:metal-responsive CopG/Arc/MetJ family transcriptional regulator
MRTIVDIPDQNTKALDAVCGRENISRAEAVRRAVADDLARHKGGGDAAFGLW